MLQVVFFAQGGCKYDGCAIGRIGRSQVLIRYSIRSGARRGRWFKRDRILKVVDHGVYNRHDAIWHELLDTLPRYKRRTCKAVKFETPVVGVRVNLREGRGYAGWYTDYPGVDRKSPCECGSKRELLCENDYTDGAHKSTAIGWRSHSTIVKAEE